MARTRPDFAFLLSSLALGACGGGTTTPNPPPPPPPPPPGSVSSVTVSPGSASPFEGDNVQLTATPLSATGAALTGKTVTWASNAQSVATVSAAGLVTAVAIGSAQITATVEGRTGTAQITVQARVALDIAHQVSKPMGAEGDSLKTTTGATSFALVVPPGALAGNVTIRMTPITALQGTGLSGGILTGLKLEPSGTVFARPLELRITNVGTVPAGKVLIGFTTPDGGGPLELLPAATVAGVTTVLVPHFSVVGLGAVLPSELAALPQPNPGTMLADFATIATILASGASQITMVQQLTLAFETWFNRIAPILAASKQDDTRMLAGLSEWAYWINTMQHAGQAIGTASFTQVPAIQLKIVSGSTDLGTGFTDAITRANTDCKAQRSLTKASLVLFWQNQAQQVLGPAIVDAFGLDRFDVLSSFCIQIINTELIFPDPVTPNQTADLRVRFGVKFGTDPNLMLPPHVFNLRIDIHGTTADGPVVVPSAADGRFTQTVVPTGQTTFQADIKACLDPILVGANDVCNTVSVSRPFGRTIVGQVTVQTATGLAGLSDVAKIQGTLSIFDNGSDPITNLDALVGLQEVTGSVVLSSMPQLTSLSGLRNLRTVTDLLLVSLAKLPSVDGLDNLRTIPGTLTLGTLPLVPNLQGLGQLLTIGTLSLSNLPLVSSLAGLSQARITKGLTVLTGLPALTSIAGPTFDPTLVGDVRLQNNPLLTNLGGLRNVTTLNGSLHLVNNPGVNIADLAALTVVEGNVQIAGPTITSVAALGIQRIGGELFITPAALPQMTTFNLPALTEFRRTLPPTPSIQHWIRIDLTGCNTAPRAPMTLSFPSLTTLPQGWTYIDPQFRPLGCVVDINVPSLVNGGGGFDLTAVRTLNLGPYVAPQGFGMGPGASLVDPTHPMTSLSLSGVSSGGSHMSIGFLPNLQTLTLTGITSGDLRLSNMPKLTSMTATGHVSDEVVFSSVPLSDAQMIAVGAALGARVVWKITASGTIKLFPSP